MAVKKNILANFLGKGWTALTSLVFLPVYLKLLGAEAYGLIGIYTILVSWLAVVDVGLTPALSREMASFAAGTRRAQSIHNILRSVEMVSTGIAILISLGIWLASHWLAQNWVQANTLPTDDVALAFTIMGVVTALRLIENIYSSCIVGLQRQIKLNVVHGSAATIRCIGAVLVLVYISPSIQAFFIWQGIVSIGTVLLLARVVYKLIPPAPQRARFSLSELKSIWRFATGTLILTIFGFVLSQTDKIVLSKLLTLKDFAYYSVAYTTASSLRMFAHPVDQAIFPKFTELYQKRDEAALATTYHKANQLTAVLIGSVGVFIIVFSDSLLALWLQDVASAAQVAPIMRILSVGMILNGLLNGPYYLQMAAGWTELLIKVNFFMMCFFVPIIYILALEYQALGAAVAWLLLHLAYFITIVPLMHRKLLRNEIRAWYLKDIGRPISAALAISIVFYLLQPPAGHVLFQVIYLSIALLAVLGISSLAAEHARMEVSAKIRVMLAKL